MEEKEFDYINVIPLVDVMLVLLTIVLTTSTFIASGAIPVELPRATAARNEIMKAQTINIDSLGNIYLNAQAVTLDGLLASLGTQRRDLPILIRADRNIHLQIFVDVLDAVKNLGFKKVSLQTEDRR